MDVPVTLILPQLKHPELIGDESRRLEELRALRLGDSSSDERFDHYAALAAGGLKMPMAAIVVVDKDMLRFKSVRGVPAKDAPRSISFAAHALSEPDVLVVPDARLDERFAAHPIVKEDPHVRFYAGAAIRGRTDQPVGAVCVMDRVPRQLSDEERDILLRLRHLIEEDLQTRAALSELSEKVSSYALHEPSTGLPNRALFLNQLNGMMRVGGQSERVILALARLVRFEDVHKAVGKIGSDYLVGEAAARLRQVCGTASLLGHPSEDTLAIACPISDQKSSNSILRKILGCFHTPFMLGDHRILAHAHIGAAAYPDDASDAETLLKRARTALSSGNDSITSRYRRYSRELSARAARRFEIESALEGALQRNELTVAYQPKLRMPGQELAGAEALLRWTNERLGSVSPAEFIPVAEESGLIVDLGAWILESASRQIAEWIQAGYVCPEVSVNVSSLQLVLPVFCSQIRAILERFSLEGHRLNLEITEASLIDNIDKAIEVMDDLRSLDVQFSIDDFGKGFSSLSYLRQMPVQVLKIDRSFISQILDRPGDAKLLGSIVAMGHALGLEVVVEGVENEEQCRVVGLSGVDQIQGFFFSRPVTAAEFRERFLQVEKRTAC